MSAARKIWTVLAAGLLALALTLAGVGFSTASTHQSGPNDGRLVEHLESQGQQVGKSCPRQCQLGQYLAVLLAPHGMMRPVERLRAPLVSDPRAVAWLSLVETGPPKV